MAQRDAAYEEHDSARVLTGAELVVRAAGQRKRAADYRAHCAEQRTLAAADRLAAAADRELAARDRLRSVADRETLMRLLAIAETDALTGARARAAGLVELEHELDRCGRTGSLLVVGYVDVVGLKVVNDTEGHLAGDRLLREVVHHIRQQLRSYDLIIRLGGDEFLCAMSDMPLASVRKRFQAVTAELAASTGGRFRVGFAEFQSEEDVDDLIARADGELTSGRRTTSESRSTAP